MGSSMESDVKFQLENLAGDIFHIHLVEQWLILTSNKFDLQIPDLPPFQTLSVLYNIETRNFVCRTLGRSLERGSLGSLEQLAKFAQETFQHKSACIGSGDFPENSIFSEGCAKYIPNLRLNSDAPEGAQPLTKFRCESCQKDLDNRPASVVLDQVENGIKLEMTANLIQEQQLVILPMNDQGCSADEDDVIGDDLDALKTEVEQGTSANSPTAELNDLVDCIKDEHEQSYSLFDSKEVCLRKSKRLRTSKRIRPINTPTIPLDEFSPPPSCEKKKIKIIYPKNVNHKPRADGKFECEYCGHAVTTRNGKTDHKKLNHGWGHFPCELCPTVYKEALGLIRHMMDAHVGVLEAMCPQCQQRVHFEGDEQVFLGHYLSCVRSRRVSQNAKQIALRRENKPKRVQCTCDTCGRLFNTLETLKIHQGIHKGKGFVCKVCGFWASHRSVLTSHMQKHEREQGKATKLVCPHCAHVSLGEVRHTNHMKRRHHPYQCQQCPKVCRGRLLFNKHKSEVHGANRCDVCTQCFTTNHLLQMHKRTHLDPSFGCQFCSKMFKTEKCKVTHERVHTGETPFKCQMCDYKCKSSATLSLHKKFKHNGGRNLRRALEEDSND